VGPPYVLPLSALASHGGPPPAPLATPLYAGGATVTSGGAMASQIRPWLKTEFLRDDEKFVSKSEGVTMVEISVRRIAYVRTTD
jgi:hypothetical protein